MKEFRRLSLTVVAAAPFFWGVGAQAQQPKGAASKQTRQAVNAAALSTLSAATSSSTGFVKGSGTINFIPLWTSSSTTGNSVLSQSGSGTSVNVSVGGALTALGPLSAPSLSGNGSGITDVNAAALGGLPATSFATQGANTFTGDQTVNGSLTLSNSFQSSALTLQGNLTDSSGDQSANVIGGFGGNSSFPGNSVASGVIGATIAGGGGVVTNGSAPNVVTANCGTVGGGFHNSASGFGATVAGRANCTASGPNATVAGGVLSTASGKLATVAGGYLNTASGENATVAGGKANLASGFNATVAGGTGNTAAGAGSFAAGNSAHANYGGSFVWGDASTASPVSDTGSNQFVARAGGGFTLYTASDLSTGATLPAGSGSWSSLSDRNVKANFSAVDEPALLTKVTTLPIATWNYKAQPSSVRHLGPMAQDFRAAFGLGEDDKHISTVDAEGVALAAIQALYRLSQEKDRKIEELSREVKELEAQVVRLAGKP